MISGCYHMKFKKATKDLDLKSNDRLYLKNRSPFAPKHYKDLKPTFGRITSDIWFRNPLKNQPMATNTLFETGYKYQMSKYKGQESVTLLGCFIAIAVAMPLIIGSLIPSPLI